MNVLLLALICCLIGIFFSGLFSGAETGAYLFNRTRHRIALAENSRRARLVQLLTTDLTAFVIVCLIGTNLANTLVAQSATIAIAHFDLTAPELIATLTIAPILFIFGELAPKELFRRHPDRLLYTTAPAMGLARALFTPVLLILTVLTALLRVIGLRAESGRNPAGEERVRQAIAAGAESGTLTAYQTTLARNIFSLTYRRVFHAMIPLDQVDCVETSTSLEEARVFAREHGHNRYPVYRDERRQIVGLVSLYDLVFEDRPGPTIRNYIQEALELEPGERVAEALVRMRRARASLAVVAREGRALGIITLKDLVEEITGELRDL